MNTIHIGLPVLYYTRRFHYDKGRRWNVIEHLILDALVQRKRTAGQLAFEGNLPRRVVLEVLVRLMRAGWVELHADTREVTFAATERGRTVAAQEELPVVTQRMARRMSFAVDCLAGGTFSRRDLTLVRYQDWAKRVKGQRATIIERPSISLQPLGQISSLIDTLFNEDERLIRVDLSTWPPAERLALITIQNGRIEGLPAQADAMLQNYLLEAAKKVPKVAAQGQSTSVEVVPNTGRVVRPVRSTSVLQDDLIVGGSAHEQHVRHVLRRARSHVVIHSTFVDLARFDALLPDIRVAVGRGCRVDIFWGHSSLSTEGTVKSFREAEKIRKRIAETGLSGSVHVHLFTTRSHGKLLIYDDGALGAMATIGSCNWLYSGFKSFEVSVRIRDPHLVSDVMFEMGELARPPDGHVPELTARLAEWARALRSKPSLPGNASAHLLIGDEHDKQILQAKEKAQREITVMSHRLGVVAKPAILIPVATAAKQRGVDIKLYYGEPSGPVKPRDATAAQVTYREQGVSLEAVRTPRIHAKLLLWDKDNVVVSSLNWLSADTHTGNPRQEIGIAISRPNIADYLRGEFERAKLFSDR